jgi:hypothetical protein
MKHLAFWVGWGSVQVWVQNADKNVSQSSVYLLGGKNNLNFFWEYDLKKELYWKS